MSQSSPFDALMELSLFGQENISSGNLLILKLTTRVLLGFPVLYMKLRVPKLII